jgi:hypothetical protein
VKRRLLLTAVGTAAVALGAAILHLHHGSTVLGRQAQGCPNGCPCWAAIDELD